MRCHYENIKGIGMVLIPGCMAVAVSDDIERCTCEETTYESFEHNSYNKEIHRLKAIIKALEEENECYRQALSKATLHE